MQENAKNRQKNWTERREAQEAAAQEQKLKNFNFSVNFLTTGSFDDDQGFFVVAYVTDRIGKIIYQTTRERYCCCDVSIEAAWNLDDCYKQSQR